MHILLGWMTAMLKIYNFLFYCYLLGFFREFLNKMCKSNGRKKYSSKNISSKIRFTGNYNRIEILWKLYVWIVAL